MGSWRDMRWGARADRALIDRMRSIWLLSDCTASEIRMIRSMCTPLDVDEGRTLVRQGDDTSQFFISARGTAVVSLDQRPVALIEAGSFFGGMALFGTGLHRATVTSATPMELLVFSRQESTDLALAPIPSVQRKIEQVLAERQEALAELARHAEGTATPAGLDDLPVLQRAAT